MQFTLPWNFTADPISGLCYYMNPTYNHEAEAIGPESTWSSKTWVGLEVAAPGAPRSRRHKVPIANRKALFWKPHGCHARVLNNVSLVLVLVWGWRGPKFVVPKAKPQPCTWKVLRNEKVKKRNKKFARRWPPGPQNLASRDKQWLQQHLKKL